MHIESVQLDGFAGLQGGRDFGPGLNLVVGPNESGKSRLVAAIHYGLCGRVKKRGRAVDPAERCRPWDKNGRSFRLSLTLKLRNGHTLEVNQNLDEPSRSRVLDVDLGRDLTTELLVDRAPDASRLLGLDRDVVPKTLLVTQGDLLTVRDGADAMQSMLQRAATSGSLDETANSALTRLEVFRTERIGTEHASSRRPLRMARDLEAQTRRSLEEVRALHASLSEERAALVQRRAELTSLEAALDDARSLEVQEEAARLQRLCARIESIDAELSRLEMDASVEGPEVGVDVLQQLRLELRAVAEAARPNPPSTPAPEAIEQELAGLPRPSPGDREPQPELEKLEQAAQVARVALARHEAEAAPEVPPPAGLDAHTLRECARDLALPAPVVPPLVSGEDPRQVRVVAFVALSSGLVALGLGAGLQAWWMLSVGLLVVALGVGATLVARKRQRRGLLREAERRAAEADLKVHQDRRAKIEATLARSGLAQADAVAIEAAARRHEETLDRIRMHATWVEHRVVLQSRLKMLEGQLAAALAAVGAADWASYVEACRERQRLEVESRRRVDLERLLSTSRREHTAHLEALRSWDERLGAIERASILLGCGPTSLPREEPISRTSLAPLVARIAELLARHDARGLRHKLSEERASLLGTEDKASLVERLGLLRSRVVGRVSQREERGVSSLELDRQITALQREVAQREAALHERLRGMPSVAELEERLDLAQREHARLRRLDRLVAMTMEQLMLARDTIHRDIAPRLSAGLSAVIPRLTGGRWERARIAVDDLAVSVMRDHEWRPAHDLSCGTAEQVYLALRVILAATLAKATEPPPLILDDVLVHADGARREELLDWLAELAERHQIILTTHDHSLVGWAQTLGGRVHELTCAT